MLYFWVDAKFWIRWEDQKVDLALGDNRLLKIKPKQREIIAKIIFNLVQHKIRSVIKYWRGGIRIGKLIIKWRKQHLKKGRDKIN